jgi:nitroreductase/SAM-dependent methyltransferase
MTYESLFDLLTYRQSTRTFSARSVDIETARRLIAAAQQAPSSCNHQLNRYVLVTDDALKQRLCDEAGTSPTIREAPLSIVLLFRMGWNHNKLSVVQSLGMSAQNLLLAAATLNLKSVIQAAIGDTEVIRKLLGIGEGYYVASIISLGYADEASPRPPRLPLDAVCGVNRLSEPVAVRYPRKNKCTAIGDYSNASSPDAIWDPDRWPDEAIATWRGLAVWHTSPRAGVHRPRRLRKEFDAEIALFANSLEPHHATLEFLPYSAAYGARLLAEESLRALPFDVFELSAYHEDFIRKRCELEGVRAPDHYFCGTDWERDLGRRYDRILVAGGLNHLPAKGSIVAFLRRHLKADGRLLISYRNRWSFHALEYVRMKRAQVGNAGPNKPISPLRFARQLGPHFAPEMTCGISLSPWGIGRTYWGGSRRYLCRTIFCVMRPR